MEMEVENIPMKDAGIKIVGIRVRDRGMIVHYDPQDIYVLPGDYVIVEADNGEEVARVVSPPRYILRILNNRPLKKVLRLPSQEEMARLEEHANVEQEAYAYCIGRINDRPAPAKPAHVE